MDARAAMMKTLLYILFVTVLLWQHLNAQNACGLPALYDVRNYILQGHVIRTVSMATILFCFEACAKDSACWTINFKLSSCELNSASHLSHPHDLTPNSGAYYAVVKPLTICSDAYCSTNTTCVVTANGIGYACECSSALGMQDRRITDLQLMISSQYDKNAKAKSGRLHHVSTFNADWGAWIAKYTDTSQWISVDFQECMIVRKVASQGLGRKRWFVKSYTIDYTMDEASWSEYKSGGVAKVFLANSDDSSVVTNALIPAVRARFLKVKPTAWVDQIAMRLEFYGCVC